MLAVAIEEGFALSIKLIMAPEIVEPVLPASAVLASCSISFTSSSLNPKLHVFPSKEVDCAD